MNYNTVYTNDNSYLGNEYINFLGDNYIWIIIILVIILMTIIGYIADKKNLIKSRKNKNPNSDSKVSENIKKVNDVINKIENENIEKESEHENNTIKDNNLFDFDDKFDEGNLEENIYSDKIIENSNLDDLSFEEEIVQTPEKLLSDEPTIEEITAESSELNDITQEEQISENVENEDFDQTVGEEDFTFSEEIPDKVDSEIDKLYELSDEDENEDTDLSFLNEDSESKEKELNDDEELKKEESIVDVDIELPDIDSIESDNSTDDFWKF